MGYPELSIYDHALLSFCSNLPSTRVTEMINYTLLLKHFFKWSETLVQAIILLTPSINQQEAAESLLL